MKTFKLHKGFSEIPILLTKENYEEATQGDDNYTKIIETGKSTTKRYLAICPSCDNPIQIVGLYVKDNTRFPYGKHYPEDFAYAKYNHQNYLYCPLASHSFGQPEKRLKKEFSEFEKTIYNLVRENFDLALYIAERKTGIHFSKNLRRSIAKEYAISKGYLYYHANAYNIPWMLLYFHSAIPCFGLTLKRESELWNFLKTCPSVQMEPALKEGYDIVRNKPGEFVEEKICFILHDLKENGESLTLSVHLPITEERHEAKVLKKIRLEIDPIVFPVLVKNRRYPQNQEEKDFLSRIMPEL